ncbi:MAG: 50S ribosomal protein L40e [Halopenitus sp.]
MKEEHVQEHNKKSVVEERLGLTKSICQSCDARNPLDANKCRKCGHTNLRSKADDFQGKGSSSS